MASVKLNAEMRTNILNEIIGDRYEVRRKELALREKAFGKKVVDFFITDEIKAKIAELPKNWFPAPYYLAVRFAGEYENFYFKDYGFQEHIAVPRCLDCVQNLPGNHPLSEERDELKNAEKDINSEETADRNRIKAILQSVSSSKQLIEVWPELETIVNKHCHGTPKMKIGLPAIVVDDINNKFNLPKQEK